MRDEGRKIRKKNSIGKRSRTASGVVRWETILLLYLGWVYLGEENNLMKFRLSNLSNWLEFNPPVMSELGPNRTISHPERRAQHPPPTQPNDRPLPAKVSGPDNPN